MPNLGETIQNQHGISQGILDHVPSVFRHPKLYAGLGVATLGLSFIHGLGAHQNQGTHIDFDNLLFQNNADLLTSVTTTTEHISSEATFHILGPDPSVQYRGEGKVAAQMIVPWQKAVAVIPSSKQAGKQEIDVDLSKVEPNVYFKDMAWTTATNRRGNIEGGLGGIAAGITGGASVDDIKSDMSDAVERSLKDKSVNGFGVACGPKLLGLEKQSIRKAIKEIIGDKNLQTKDFVTKFVGGPIDWSQPSNITLNPKAVTVGNPKLDSLSCDTSNIKVTNETKK